MNEEELCRALLSAETDSEVKTLLQSAGYWDVSSAWRPVGDTEANYSIIGSQAADPFGALSEKIINSIDAVLISECRVRGIDPSGPRAPQSMREAIARFFEDHTGPLRERDGRIDYWRDRGIDETAVARRIMISATGPRIPGSPQPPSISIADDGEGQTPDDFPTTLLSLQRSNKATIQFVQGKWNMGGTGVLPFCSDPHKFQLIISRRNPSLLPSNAIGRDHEWGYTVVRKRAQRAGERRPVFEYLAPVDVRGSDFNSVLAFESKSMPIFPSEAPVKAYGREAKSGTLVKLYEYRWETAEASRGTILLGKSLLTQLQCCLPTIALPTRLFEGRDFKSSSAAFNMTGLVNRLLNEPDNLEPESPIRSELTVEGQVLPIQVFVFSSAKNVKPETFIGKNGVLLTVNGQKHHSYPTTFFARKSVDLSYIRKHMVSVIDCTDMDPAVRDEAFMNSRDRIRRNDFTSKLEDELISFLHSNDDLRTINNRRHEEEIQGQLDDTGPLESVIYRLLSQSPLLASFFKLGSRVPSPFPGGGAGGKGHSKFEGRYHPSYFRFRKGGEVTTREVPLGQRARLEFETDAEDSYFDRNDVPGRRVVTSSDQASFSGSWGGLKNGALSYSLQLPDEAETGDEFAMRFEISDDVLPEPFNCNALIKVSAPATPRRGGGKGERVNPNANSGGSGGQQRIEIPPIIAKSHHTEDDWTETTAVEVQMSEGKASEFFYNKDNKYLKAAQKSSRTDPRVMEARFKIGLVLIGLSIIDWTSRQTAEEDEEVDIADKVRTITDAIAPVLLPMLEALEGIDPNDFAEPDVE
jgi:hypothetical protein